MKIQLNKTKYMIIDVIDNVLFSSSVPVECFENKQLFFAKRLNEAMKVLSELFSFSNVAILRSERFFFPSYSYICW